MHGYNIEIAKWLVAEYAVDVHADNNAVFQTACDRGCFEIAEWLVAEHAVDIHANNEMAFCTACYRSYCESSMNISEYQQYDVTGYEKIIKWFEQELSQDMHYFCHNYRPYIINHAPIPEWQHCMILDCPVCIYLK